MNLTKTLGNTNSLYGVCFLVSVRKKHINMRISSGQFNGLEFTTTQKN